MTATVSAPPRASRDETASRKTIPFGAPPRVSLVPPEIGERADYLSSASPRSPYRPHVQAPSLHAGSDLPSGERWVLGAVVAE